VGSRLGESVAVFGGVLRNPNLRRLELAWMSSVLGHWAWGVALAVYAYQQGGATAVGVLGLVKMIPSTLGSPFTGGLGDRFPRERVLFVTDLLRAAAVLGAAALVAAEAPLAVIFVVAGCYQLIATAFRPNQAALVPSLARDPEEATAANVASTSVENVGTFIGPAIAGFLIAAWSVELAFAVTAAAFLVSALLVSRIRQPAADEAARPAKAPFRQEAFRGFRALAENRDVRLLVGLYGAQMFVNGLMNVLLVVAAFELLDAGESGVGLLYSAIGVGGVIGALIAAARLGRRRLAGDLRIGMVLYGVPLAAIAAVHEPAFAIALMAVLGVGSTIIDVSAITLMQRAVPDDVLARVFGVLGSVMLGMLGIGAIVAPALIELVGLETTLVVSGALLPALMVLTFRRVGQIDRRAEVPHELELLRRNPIFAPLPGPVLEQLASSLQAVHAAPGEQLVREGDRGDRFYVVARGVLDVSAGGEKVRELGPGDSFGEIALLRDVPRTATVTAREDAELFALDRDEFVSAVTGNPQSAEAADAVVGARLGAVRTGVVTV
jgi:predicted MFS family arabinose efflux permease